MIEEFKEWKKQQAPFTNDDEFFNGKELKSVLKEMFKEMYVHHEVLTKISNVLLEMNKRIDEIEE